MMSVLSKSGLIGYLIVFLMIVSLIVSFERLIFLFIKRNKFLGEVDISNPSETASNVISEMESSVWIISLISNIAPLLGMLGTILGLINMFRSIERTCAGVDITIISTGVWEAMLTTAMGITVALVSTVFYRFIERQIEKRIVDIEVFISSEKG